jgi:hypothetical protein
MNLVERTRKIILEPRTEWPVIAEEQLTLQDIYTKYVMILAAIPAIASFIGWSIVGIGIFGQTHRVPLGAGLAHLILGYLLSLGSVYLLALVIDSFAPKFEGQSNFVQALKVAAFASAPSWLAGVFYVVPALGIFALLGLYSLYLLFLGLPLLMKVPADKALPYTVVVMVAVIVVVVVVRAVAALTIPGTVRGF